MIWTAKKELHGSELHTYFVHRDVPVIIHRVGSYPCLVNEEGTSSFYHPHIMVCVSSMHREVIITALSGTNLHGRRPSAEIARLPYIEKVEDQVEAVRPYLDEAADRTATVHTEFETALGKIMAVLGADLSREEYEAACATHGVKVYADEDLGRKAEIDFIVTTYPQYPVEKCIEKRLAFRRWIPLKAAQKAAQEAEQAARAEEDRIARAATLARLQALPVSSTETRRLPAMHALGVGVSFIDSRGRLLTVVRSEYRGIITDDDPSVHGEHLSGCEGKMSYDVTYEIRQEAAECPVL